MMCFSSICCYDHSFQTVHVSDVWRILYGDYLSANIQDVGRHPHSLSLKRKLQTGVVMAIPLQGLQISWLWKEQQKTSSWHMWLKLYFASSRDNQAHQICPNQGLNMLLSAKVDQPLLSHRAGSRPSTPSMVSVPWNKGNLLSQNDVVKKQGISIKIIPQFGGGGVKLDANGKLLVFVWEISPIIIVHEVWLCNIMTACFSQRLMNESPRMKF